MQIEQEIKLKVSIIIPLYNEKDTIKELIRRVKSAVLPDKIQREIIIVDDGSTDGSVDEKDIDIYPDIIFLRHERNMGKGYAVRTAFKKVSGEIIIIQDADLEYDPNEYTKLLQPILSDKADVVYGSRFISGDSRRIHLFRHYMGNKFLTFLSNLFSNYNHSDIETGYKVFKTEIARKLKLRENGFGFEAEITQKFAKVKARMYEVGISYHGRDFQDGKKIKPIRDGIRALICIIKYGMGLG